MGEISSVLAVTIVRECAPRSNELARYQAVSARAVASSPPPDEATITATLDRAGERAVFWTAWAKHAQSNADAIVAREEHAVAAAAC